MQYAHMSTMLSLVPMVSVRRTRIEPKSDFDYRFFVQQVPEKSRFKQLRADWFKKSHNTRLNFGYIKFYATERVEITFVQQLHLMYKMNETYGPEPSNELTHNLFSWELKYYIERRALPDLTFVQVLKKIPEKDLDLYKFRVDLLQLLDYVTLLFDGVYAEMGQVDLDLHEHVEYPLCDARSLLLQMSLLEKEYKQNISKYVVMINSRWLMTTGDEGVEQKRLKAHLESKLLYSHIWDPIETRYVINWYQTKLNEKEEKIEMMENSLSNGIEQYKILDIYESKNNSNCLEYLFGSIEQIKNEILKMQVKFEIEVENIDSKLVGQRVKIDKLRDRQRFLKGEIKRFHEEIDQWNAGVYKIRDAATLRKKRSVSQRSTHII